MTEPDEPRAKRCETCAWHNDRRLGASAQLVECRYNPPLATGGLHGPTETVFPLVERGWYCSRWKVPDGDPAENLEQVAV